MPGRFCAKRGMFAFSETMDFKSRQSNIPTRRVFFFGRYGLSRFNAARVFAPFVCIA